MTYDELVTLARSLPGVEESTMYGDPAIKREGRFMVAMKQDGGTIAVKLDWDSHDRFLDENPGLIYKTPHYEGWPGFLVNLDLLEPDLAWQLVSASWEDAPMPSKRRRLP